MIGEGNESRVLYYLGTRSSTSCVASSSPKLLHERLGYSHLSKLKKMVSKLNSLRTLECESCQLGKHVRKLNILNLDVILFSLSSILMFGGQVVCHILVLDILLLSLMSFLNALEFI